MPTLHWMNGGGIELRLGTLAPILRFVLGRERRSGAGPLFLGSGAGLSMSAVGPRLPAALLPLVSRVGDRVAAAAVLARANGPIEAIVGQLVLPPTHPPVLAAESGLESRTIEALFLPGLSDAAAEELQRLAGLLPGLLLREDERVDQLGQDLEPATRTHWLRRLPRIVVEGHHLIADNTDGALSMGTLLDEFVRRFIDGGTALPHVRLATGYLYRHGLERVLRLLRQPELESLHVLFSGQTDARTAAAITSQLARELVPGVEDDASGGVYALYREALESGRLQFRVYTDAFLHAKLFLGWEAANKHGHLNGSYAVVGSSNLSIGGLAHAGNLELDVTLQDNERNARLLDWFNARWEEGSPPEPALLDVLETHRPRPPPVFAVPGLEVVHQAGLEGRLASPERHLALLAKLYNHRLARVRLPDRVAFPELPGRDLVPSVEQEEGVLALAQRLLAARMAFLADSVGLGKTATALGTLWYLLRHDKAKKAAVIAPKKLFVQWRDDADGIGLPRELLRLVNRHNLERYTAQEAAATLHGVDLLVVEEAHEALRNRSNKLWEHVRAHLRANPECRLLLISATPWNNRREDIFNYLLLAWNEGRGLKELYPALDAAPLSNQLGMFMVGVAGSLSGAQAVKRFDALPSENWRRLFDEVFVQRTRSSLLRRYGITNDFPERRVHAHSTPPSEQHDALFASLEVALSELTIPYQEPVRALLRAAAATGDDAEAGPEASNLRRSFLIQLFNPDYSPDRRRDARESA